MATPGTHNNRRAIIAGVVIWVAFAVIAVALRGIRWDETYEHAQAIARQIPYPDGHPLFRYCRNAFSLQTYASAAMVWLGAGPTIVCGLRNVLALLSTVLPMFLFGAWLGRGALWGHVAALLALRGLCLEFDGSYPLTVWPDIFSNGIVGGGYALVVLYVLLRKHWRTAFFLVGLMPCVHVGQWPPVLAMASLLALEPFRKLEWQTLRRIVISFLSGLMVCVAFAFVIKPFAVSAPTGGPYAVPGDAQAIWKGYTVYCDGHRQFPPGNGHVVMVGLLLLGGLSLFTRERQTAGLFLYGAVIAGVVWGIMLVHGWMGAETPFLFIGWMPYRLINHIAPLLAALCVGVLAVDREESRPAGRVLLAGALAYGIALPYLPYVVGPVLHARYLASCDSLFFALYGAAGIEVLRSTDRRFRPLAGAVVVGAPVCLGFYHHLGAACVVAGALSLLAIGGVPHLSRVGGRVVVSALCVVLGLGLLVEQMRQYANLPTRAFDRRVATELAARGEPDAMLVARPNEFLLQAKTGHPVFVETATASLMSYMPALSPVIDRMYRDAFGITFEQGGQSAPPLPWTAVWAERTREEWQRFADTYDVRYVVAPLDVALSIPLVFRETGAALYRIPRETK